MNPFNKLSHGIPLHEASAFFIKIKQGSSAFIDQEDLEEEAKVAASAEVPTEVSQLASAQPAVEEKTASVVERFHPETLSYHGSIMKKALAAMSPNVFVPTIDEEGNIKEASRSMPSPLKGKSELGRDLGKKALIGLGLGAATIAGANAIARKFPKKDKKKEASYVELAARMHKAANAALGQHAAPPPTPPLQGAAAGQHAMPPPPAPLQGQAAGQVAKVAERMKKAFEEMQAEPEAQVASNTPPSKKPTSEEANELEAYLAAEQEADQAATGSEGQFYKQRFQEAAQQLQALQEEVAAKDEQLQTLQSTVDQNSQMNNNALSQAQQIQEQAMSQANAANVAAAAAMQKTLASQNELLEQQQLAINMRDAVQAMKTDVLKMVQTQLPPATTMEAGMSAAADQAHADQQAMQEQMLAEQGVDPAQVAAQAPGGAPAEGQPPGAPAQPGAEAAPAPGGEPPAAEGAAPTGEKKPEKKPEGEKKPEPSSEDKEKEASAAFTGALLGGAAGAVGAGLEARRSNDPLRDKVKKLEAAEQAEGGFGNALNLAQSKMRLAVSELAEKHPNAAALAGAGMGAAAGAKIGPNVASIAKSLRG